MTLGGIAAHKLGQKKRAAQLAAAFPNGAKCQKCLEYGHWSYECKGKRKFVHRTSRSKQLNKKISQMTTPNHNIKTVEPKRKKQKTNSSSNSSSSDSDGSNSESSSSSSSSSSSGSGSSTSSSSSSSGSSDSDSDSSTS